MKRLILMAVVALAALPAAAQIQEAFPSYVQVNGRAEKEITPDEFYLQIIINERDSKGKISVESQQRDMIAALKKLGVDVEKQLKVANLSSEFFKKKTSVATAKYQLQLGTSAEVARAWQALDNLGISDVSILKVSHSKIDEYKEQAAKSVKVRLVMEEIVKREEMKFEQDELDAKVAEMAERAGQDVETFKKGLGREHYDYLANQILSDKLMAMLREENAPAAKKAAKKASDDKAEAEKKPAAKKTAKKAEAADGEAKPAKKAAKKAEAPEA